MQKTERGEIPLFFVRLLCRTLDPCRSRSAVFPEKSFNIKIFVRKGMNAARRREAHEQANSIKNVSGPGRGQVRVGLFGSRLTRIGAE
jgi:hypothetical protein